LLGCSSGVSHPGELLTAFFSFILALFLTGYAVSFRTEYSLVARLLFVWGILTADPRTQASLSFGYVLSDGSNDASEAKLVGARSSVIPPPPSRSSSPFFRLRPELSLFLLMSARAARHFHLMPPSSVFNFLSFSLSLCRPSPCPFPISPPPPFSAASFFYATLRRPFLIGVFVSGRTQPPQPPFRPSSDRFPGTSWSKKTTRAIISACA